MSTRENERKASGGFKALKRLRIDSGMKQSELAEALGVSKYTVSAWERGIQVPSWGHLAALAWIFNTDIGGLARDLGLGGDSPDGGIPLESLTDDQTPVDQMIVISKILHLFTLLDERGRKTVKTAFEMSEYPPKPKCQPYRAEGGKGGRPDAGEHD